MRLRSAADTYAGGMSRLRRPPSRRGHDGRQPAGSDRTEVASDRVGVLTACGRRHRRQLHLTQKLSQEHCGFFAARDKPLQLIQPRAEVARERGIEESEHALIRPAGRQRCDMVDGDRSWMRRERQLVDLCFEMCQVWRAIVPRVAWLAVPALRIEGLGQSLRRTAVDAGFGLDCGSFDPGDQCGAARWLAGDDLALAARRS